MWQLFYTKQARKDAIIISASGCKENVIKLLVIIKQDPYQNTPPYENLVGDLSGACSRKRSIFSTAWYIKS
jgi:toxin YoeB